MQEACRRGGEASAIWRKSHGANRLHVVDAVFYGNLGEGDAGGGGFAGGQHAAEVQCGVAVFQIELVHRGGEIGTVAGVGEKLGLVLVFGDETAKGDTDEEGSVEFGTLRALSPERTKNFEEGESVLAVAEAGFHPPAGVFDAGGVPFDFAVRGTSFCLFARKLVANGDGKGASVEVLHT